MEAELVTLIGTGATTMVGLMATDAWEGAKQHMTRLLARGRETDTVVAELTESRASLIAVAGTTDEETLTADLTAALRLQLRRLLEQEPGAADELRRLVDEFAPTVPPISPGTVQNSITGGTQQGPVIQGHTFTSLTIGTPGRTPPDRTV
ncbi:hypothetical protein OH768_47070 [Streptomyces sp. NBC_01622]|uniref:hypothetical protein n=1 Tax=Streptomyces sp. NBC_01622 TaxID=2975903 RepID=UPI00386EB561|nr:hypothetical protein OH768_47070 [Streptomyces sp. NBC_01622]